MGKGKHHGHRRHKKKAKKKAKKHLKRQMKLRRLRNKRRFGHKVRKQKRKTNKPVTSIHMVAHNANHHKQYYAKTGKVPASRKAAAKKHMSGLAMQHAGIRSTDSAATKAFKRHLARQASKIASPKVAELQHKRHVLAKLNNS